MNKVLEQILREKSVDDLLFGALEIDDVKMVKILHRNGFLNFKEKYDEDNTILHFAAVLNCNKIFKYATKHKADVFAINKFNRTPLDYAKVNAKDAINAVEKEKAFDIIEMIQEIKEKQNPEHMIK